ncbi:LCP family protein [Paenibacillus macerans]|uniref:Cell envelope-related function transcriptional attenuator common domain protein n=1 Tax=Paenibacillus macerans TaxID=44252 RepID=A0A091A117_PAEMA|nr:LCP family protein [Paenibacillus macerans]KFN10001.1 cell envelope-related function transcriptional attenuator common domain protein [Paenibacillus macerans]MCY7557482.1 LCP family protein [Paenibacillus macerans]MEC0137075.1 LCP family protein [Paenibacillus macerans]MEC0153242.1 LCP family protein [Paenibacillus macerans]MUG22889.1 LytR family transcriptional regulator [Paenibacillus macerans]
MSSNRSGLPPRKQTQSRSTKKTLKKKKKPSGIRTFFKILLTVMIVAIIGAGLYAGYLIYTTDQVIDATGTSGKVAPEKSAKVKPLTMLLLGTDYRPETGTHLSDVMMVVAMNPNTKSATIVSLPRDTKLEMDGYKTNKINAFYPNFLVAEKKSGIPAEQEMKTMMSKFFGTSIDYVTVINFQGFRDIVDALGGVDVNVDADMCYRDRADGTDINLKKGAQHLNGEDALGYVRYRKSNCRPRTKGSDDFDRNRRQNEVLHALIDQAKSLNGVLGAGKVIQSVGKNLETDLESEQMKNLISAYWDISKENVDFMPVTGDWKSPFVYLHQDELDAAKQALKDELAGTKQPAREDNAAEAADGSLND